jgi:thioredoxin reductase
MKDDTYDVVIVGGGAAGLSAALVLGRARRRVAVIDAGAPRNAPAAHLHGFLSRDGMSPAGLLATGQAEVTGYGVELVSDQVSPSPSGPPTQARPRSATSPPAPTSPAPTSGSSPSS